MVSYPRYDGCWVKAGMSYIRENRKLSTIHCGGQQIYLNTNEISITLGRFKNVEIEGLLFKDFGKTFLDSLNKAIKLSNLSEEEALKKLVPKFNEFLSYYEESISRGFFYRV